MAKRSKRASNGAWKKDGALWTYRDLNLGEALYLSFSGPDPIVGAGWRVSRTFTTKHNRYGYNAMAEFGNNKMTVDEAKKHVERNYDKLAGTLQSSFEFYELRKARLAEKAEMKA